MYYVLFYIRIRYCVAAVVVVATRQTVRKLMSSLIKIKIRHQKNRVSSTLQFSCSEVECVFVESNIVNFMTFLCVEIYKLCKLTLTAVKRGLAKRGPVSRTEEPYRETRRLQVTHVSNGPDGATKGSAWKIRHDTRSGNTSKK